MDSTVKTIITRDLIPEAPGSRFPQVNVTYAEAAAEAAKLGGRLPTEAEVVQLFAQDPWSHVAYSWTTTSLDGWVVVRGGDWFDDPGLVRASDRGWAAPGLRHDNLGFFVVREIEDDAPVPEGWVAL